MIDNSQCDCCKKMVDVSAIHETIAFGIQTFACVECTGGELSECDICQAHGDAECFSHVGHLWVCEDCQEHVLG